MGATCLYGDWHVRITDWFKRDDEYQPAAHDCAQ
jgi:hypothetical protein